MAGSPESALSPATVADLRAAAAREAGPFVDPTLLRRYTAVRRTLPDAWVTAVVGRPAAHTPLSWPEMILVVRASDADHAYLAGRRSTPTSTAPTGAQASAATGSPTAEDQRDAWAALRRSLPIAVHVGHNWTIGHHATHRTGRDHIVVQEPLTVGRLRRDLHQALCETPSTRTGRRLDPLRALDRTPEQSGTSDQPDRLPTCTRCLTVARNLSTALPEVTS